MKNTDKDIANELTEVKDLLINITENITIENNLTHNDLCGISFKKYSNYIESYSDAIFYYNMFLIYKYHFHFAFLNNF